LPVSNSSIAFHPEERSDEGPAVASRYFRIGGHPRPALLRGDHSFAVSEGISRRAWRTLCRMNEREDFLQHFRPVFIGMVERLETMTEAQVLDCLLEVKAARGIWKEEFAERIEELINAEPPGRPRVPLAGQATREELIRAQRAQLDYLGSIQAFFNSVNKLNSRAGANARPLGALPSAIDSLEDALNERLESLRKRPNSDC
jgi:hypothetical protein